MSTRRPNDHHEDFTEFGFREIGGDSTQDKYLNGEISRRSPEFRRAFQQSTFREELVEMEGIVESLKRSPKTPDLCGSILDAVNERRPFVAPQGRRWISAWRMSAAAGLLLALGGVAVMQRMKPEVLDLTPSPRPLSTVVAAASETRVPISGSSVVGIVAERMTSQSAPAARRDATPLLGRTLAGLGVVRQVEVLPAENGWAGRQAGGIMPVTTELWDTVGAQWRLAGEGWAVARTGSEQHGAMVIPASGWKPGRIRLRPVEPMPGALDAASLVGPF